MMPETTNNGRPGWVSVEIPALSLTFVGRPPLTLEHDPLSMFFVDDPQPEQFRHLDLVERGALRALASGLLAALDLYEDAIRDDA